MVVAVPLFCRMIVLSIAIPVVIFSAFFAFGFVFCFRTLRRGRGVIVRGGCFSVGLRFCVIGLGLGVCTWPHMWRRFCRSGSHLFFGRFGQGR